MANLENTSLTDITAQQIQFCNGIKAIIDGGCSAASISLILDELCDRMELIDQMVNLEISNR